MSTSISHTASTTKTTQPNKFDLEATANIIDNGVQRFFREPEFGDKKIKMSFKRDTVDPSKFVIEAYVEQLTDKKKRQKVVQSCMDNCDCLHHLMAMKRQKKELDKPKLKSLGGQSAFHHVNPQEHARDVLQKKHPAYNPRSLSLVSRSSAAKK